MYKMDYFYPHNRGSSIIHGFEMWLKEKGDIQIISHSVSVDDDGDCIVTVIYKG